MYKNFLFYRQLSRVLVEENNVLAYIERLLFCQHNSPLETFVDILKVILCIEEIQSCTCTCPHLCISAYMYITLYFFAMQCLVDHGDNFADRVAKNETIVFLIGCYIFSPREGLQDSCFQILISLFKIRPQIAALLFEKGLQLSLVSMASFIL